MSEAKYVYVRTDYSGMAIPGDGDDTQRYRVENGVLVYDPEPVAEPEVNEERWACLYANGELFVLPAGHEVGSNPGVWTRHRVRVLDKATADEWEAEAKRKREFRRGEWEERTRLKEQVATLTRERDEAREQRSEAVSIAMRMRDEADKANRRIGELERERAEAIKARDDWQMSAEWGWGDVGHGTELLKKAEDRIAELERQLAEAKARERYPEVADFLDAFGAVGWSLSYNPNSDPSKLASAWTRALPRDVYFNRPTIAAACRAALAAKEKTDG